MSGGNFKTNLTKLEPSWKESVSESLSTLYGLRPVCNLSYNAKPTPTASPTIFFLQKNFVIQRKVFEDYHYRHIRLLFIPMCLTHSIEYLIQNFVCCSYLSLTICLHHILHRLGSYSFLTPYTW